MGLIRPQESAGGIANAAGSKNAMSPSLRDGYCPKHNRTYHGVRCPQCAEDDEKARLERALEPLKRAWEKKEAGEQLQLILANLKEATELHLEEFPMNATGQPLVTTFQVSVDA